MIAAYSSLTRTQKLAAFLILLGPESAGELLRNFSGAQLEAVAKEMVSIPYVDPGMRDAILEEFSSVVFEGIQAALGGATMAQHSLELAKGDFQAVKVMSRVSPVSPKDLDDGMSEMDGRQIFNLLRAEQMQTIAFILSFMDARKASEVVQLLSAEQREEVIERLGTMEPTSRDWVKKVSGNLQKHFDRRAQQGLQKAGGIDVAAEILNTLDKESRKALLGALDVRNKDLGNAIRKKVFGFVDLVRLAPSDLQKILKEVEISDLAKALKGASAETAAAFYAIMSKRQAAGVKEEVEVLPTMRAKDVEKAQDLVIAVARKLDESGDISLDLSE
ncbi:MAG: FliG C-terminal domain-containing protein [Verrucomicrobiota bacterium]